MFDIKGQTNAHKDDVQRFFVPDDKVDPTFSPQKNKAIIEQSIKDYEAMRAKKAKSQDEPFAERADAVVSYLKHLTFSGRADGGNTPVEQYFGKRMLAKLRGEEIRERLMAGLQVRDKDGTLIR